MAVPELVEQIDKRRKTINLSSAIRLFVFGYFRGPPRLTSKPEIRRFSGNFRFVPIAQEF